MTYRTLATLDNHSDTLNNTSMHTANTKLQIVAELQLEVRSARTRAGLTLAEAGTRLGYPAHRSAEDMERLETLEPSNTNSRRMLVQHLTSALKVLA